MTRPTAPTLSSATAGNANVTLDLESAPATNGGSQIGGYNIYRGTTSGGEIMIATVNARHQLPGHDRRQRHHLLLPSHSHQRLRRERTLQRKIRNTHRPRDRPRRPTLNTTTAGTNSVALTWNAPTSNGGSPITGYKVYRSHPRHRDPPHHARKRHQLDGQRGDFGNTYYYQVTAVNSVGESRPRTSGTPRRPRPWPCPVRRR